MPKNVPITDEGYEDFEAFFSGNGGDAGPSRSAAKSSKSNKGSAAAAGPTAAADLLSKAARREARSKQDTNVFAPNFELGAVGRRTGIKIRNDVPRTQEGYEDFEAFFKSPTGATGHKSKRSSRPSVRTSAASSIGVGRRASTATDVDKSAWSVANGHEDDEDEDSEQDEGACVGVLQSNVGLVGWLIVYDTPVFDKDRHARSHCARASGRLRVRSWCRCTRKRLLR